ncbi:MAG: 4a-hydroxytetrahydrobiopterin dehydratase [Daejeonella sp.]
MEWQEIVSEKDPQSSYLLKNYVFKDFITAWAFMSQVALLAEKIDHHPDWSNVYNRVTIRLNTHDAGNKITDKDRKLAALIDKIKV